MPGKFIHREEVRRIFQGYADKGVGTLEVILDQPIIDKLEAALFPPATKEQMVSAFADAKQLLELRGVSSENATFVAVTAEAKKAVAATPKPKP